MTFDPLSILQLAIQYGPTVKSIWDTASSNADAVNKITSLSKPLAVLLEQIGMNLFPKAAPQIHLVGGIIAAFDPNVTKWLQGSLNQLIKPSPGLVVDGQYGPRTAAAVEKIQAQLGLTVDGLAGQVTQAAIQALMVKVGA